MDPRTRVSRTADVAGVARRYEIEQHEIDLFAVTLFEGSQPAGPTDLMRSRNDAEHLGEQWLNPGDSRLGD